MISIDQTRSVCGNWYFRSAAAPKASSFGHKDSGAVKRTRKKKISLDRVCTFRMVLLSLLWTMVCWNLPERCISRCISSGYQTSIHLFKDSENITGEAILIALVGVEVNPGPSPIHQCELCNSSFSRLGNLKRHVTARHTNQTSNITCFVCGESDLKTLKDWKLHMITHKPKSEKWRKTKSAFDDKVIEIARLYDVKTSLEEALGEKMLLSVLKQIQYYRRLHGSIKYVLNIRVKMRKNVNYETVVESFFFSGRNRNATSGELGLAQNVQQEFRLLTERVLDLDQDREGSGWSYEAAEVRKYFENIGYHPIIDMLRILNP